MSDVVSKSNSYSKKKDIIYYIHSAIAIGLMFFFGNVPPFGQITPLGMEILGIFLGLLYAWVFVDLLWPSLLSMVALGMTEYTTVKGAFLNGFGNDLTLMILFFLVFAAYLDMVGLSRIIANWFISRKIVRGRPWVFVSMLFLACYVLGATVSLFATIVIVWGIFYNICEMLGIQPKDKFAGYMIMGIAQATVWGFCIFPFKPFGLLVLGILEKTSGMVIDFIPFTIFLGILSLLSMGIYILFGKFILKPDVGALADQQSDYFAEFRETKLNNEQKVATVYMVVFLLLMFLPSILPKGWVIAQELNKLGTLGAIAVMLILLCAAQYKNARITTFDKLARQGLSWQIVILMAATMPMGVALESKETGIIATLVSILTPILSDVSPFMFITICFIILGIATQFAHNLVLAVVFTPILCKMAIEMGANPAVLAVGFVIVLQMSLVTPGASTHSAMIHANSWISNAQAYLYGLFMVVSTDLVMIFIGIPLGNLMF